MTFKYILANPPKIKNDLLSFSIIVDVHAIIYITHIRSLCTAKSSAKKGVGRTWTACAGICAARRTVYG